MAVPAAGMPVSGSKVDAKSMASFDGM